MLAFAAFPKHFRRNPYWNTQSNFYDGVHSHKPTNKQANNIILEIIWPHYENVCPNTWSWSMSKLLLYCKHTGAHFHLFIKVTQQKKLWAQKAKGLQVLTTSST